MLLKKQFQYFNFFNKSEINGRIVRPESDLQILMLKSFQTTFKIVIIKTLSYLTFSMNSCKFQGIYRTKYIISSIGKKEKPYLNQGVWKWKRNCEWKTDLLALEEIFVAFTYHFQFIPILQTIVGAQHTDKKSPRKKSF